MAMKARATAIKAIEKLGCPELLKPPDPLETGEVSSDGTTEHAKRYQEMLKTKRKLGI